MKRTKKREVHKKKSKTEIERISTGIKNFDKLIENGFEKKSVNIISGVSGSGKTILTTQFLVEGMKNKENCLLISFQEKKEQFFNNMNNFNWNLKEFEEKGLFHFLEYTPEKIKSMLEEGGGSIESIVLTKKITRIVIDSITSFSLLYNDELERREATTNLFNMLREWGCTAFITSDSSELKETADFESDSLIKLYFIRNEEKRERFIEIVKMKGTSHSNKIYEVIISEKGIITDPKPLSKIKTKALGI